MYEFVATDADKVTVSAFEAAVYNAMFERKHGRSSAGLSQQEIRQSL